MNKQFKPIDKSKRVYYDTKPERESVVSVHLPRGGKFERIQGRLWLRTEKRGYIE